MKMSARVAMIIGGINEIFSQWRSYRRQLIGGGLAA
jgi:hypothetical protein